jgi:glycine reductase complex component B subunit gamma
VIRVVHYLNQFYARLGGEAAADAPLSMLSGAVGPGVRLNQLLQPNAEVVATLACGDNVASEESSAFATEVADALRSLVPDVLVAGPAFNAGRYGLACGVACSSAAQLGIPSVTAMYPENPGVTLYRRAATILPTGATAVGMEASLKRLADFALRLGRHEQLGPPWVDGYLAQGFRRVELRDRPAAQRALDLLAARLRGEPFETEVPLPEVAHVAPAPPVADLRTATVAVVTTSALVPHGNPDRMRQSYSSEFRTYSLEGLASLEPGEWESIHGGFDTSAANSDPNLVVPLDALRTLEGHVYGRLHPAYYVTAGVGTPVSAAQRMGAEIAQQLLAADVGGVVLTAT